MKIRFFGDSWFWNWGAQTLKSSQMKKFVDSSGGFPIVEIYLKFLGIDCERHNRQGNTFLDTTQSILEQTDHNDVKYNIVFFSSHIRRNTEQWIDYFDFSDYNKFIDQFNTRTLYLLDEIQNWAEKNNQQVILVGGQSTLYKTVFDKLENNKNLHLLHECIISYFFNIIDGPYGIFKLATDITDFIKDDWHPGIINHLYEDIERFRLDDKTLYVSWPDKGHLNSTGSFYLLDSIFNKIESLENNRI